MVPPDQFQRRYKTMVTAGMCYTSHLRRKVLDRILYPDLYNSAWSLSSALKRSTYLRTPLFVYLAHRPFDQHAAVTFLPCKLFFIGFCFHHMTCLPGTYFFVFFPFVLPSITTQIWYNLQKIFLDVLGTSQRQWSGKRRRWSFSWDKNYVYNFNKDILTHLFATFDRRNKCKRYSQNCLQQVNMTYMLSGTECPYPSLR